MNTNNYKAHQIIVFDGLCNLCNSSVNYIIKHDNKNRFYFAASQTEKGKELLKNIGLNDITTIVLIENTKIYYKSSAALRIAKHLNGIIPLLYVLILVPPFIRNAIYDFVVKNRYRWFGRRESCMIPTEKTKSKFIL